MYTQMEVRQMKKKNRVGLRIDDDRLNRWRRGAQILDCDMSELITEAMDTYLEKKLKGFCSNLEKEIFDLECLIDAKREKLKREKS